MSKKKWMSSLLAAALAFTTVFSTGSAVKADGNNTSADKITVFVAAEGKDAAGNEVNTGKLPVHWKYYGTEGLHERLLVLLCKWRLFTIRNWPDCFEG